MQHQAVQTEEVRTPDPLSAVPRRVLCHLACAVVPRLVLIGALLGITGGISPSQLAHAAGVDTSTGTGCASSHQPGHEGRSCH